MIHINRVRILFKPLLLLYGWLLALPYYIYVQILFITCRFRFKGTDISAYPHCIHCTWHDSLGLYLTVFIKRMGNQAWMSHPAWYMSHIIVLLKLLGVKKICLG